MNLQADRGDPGGTGGTGGARPGQRNHNARLTDAKVRAIRRRQVAGEPQVALAREFGVSAATVHNIWPGRAGAPKEAPPLSRP